MIKLNLLFCSLVSYNKQLELYQLIDSDKPDIIISTETHLNKDIDGREIFLLTMFIHHQSEKIRTQVKKEEV